MAYIVEDDDDDIYRNQSRMVWDSRSRRWVRVGASAPPPRQPSTQMVPAQPQVVYEQAPAPVMWPTANRAPIVSPFGNIRLGVMLNVAAQAIAAIQPLPSPPSENDGDIRVSELTEYVESLAKHFQRQVQVKTLGALGQAFLG